MSIKSILHKAHIEDLWWHKEIWKMEKNKIRLLTSKYNDLCKASGLLPKKIRMQVAGYRRVKT